MGATLPAYLDVNSTSLDTLRNSVVAQWMWGIQERLTSVSGAVFLSISNAAKQCAFWALSKVIKIN